MNEYELMCKNSPVQKDCNPEPEIAVDYSYCENCKKELTDLDIIQEGYPISGIYYVCVFCGNSEIIYKQRMVENTKIWLPNQENWQEILEKYLKANNRGTNVYTILAKFSNITIPFTVSVTNINKYFTIAWCLFIHKEVYGLIWDWDKKKWVKK